MAKPALSTGGAEKKLVDRQNMGQNHSSASAAPASQPPPSTSSTSTSKERVENDNSHNFGQPRHPLQKATLDSPEGKTGASKHVTDCRQQQRESLRCIEENYTNKDKVCVPFFEAYKKCRREEHERKLEKNRKDSEKFWA